MLGGLFPYNCETNGSNTCGVRAKQEGEVVGAVVLEGLQQGILIPKPNRRNPRELTKLVFEKELVWYDPVFEKLESPVVD